VAGTLPGQFNEPWDVAADARGDLFIADRGNHRVQKFERRRRRFRTFDGTTLAALAFQVLYGADAGERFVYVPARRRLERWPAALGHEPNDINEAEIISEEVASVRQARQAVLQEIKAKGARDILLERWRDYPTGLAAYPQPETPFQSPAHLAVDRRGRLFVVDADADDVKVLDRQGRVLGRVRYAEDVPHDFKPTAVTVDAEGKLVIAGTGGAHRFDVEDGQTFYADFYSAWRGRCAGLASTTEGEIFGVGPKGGLAALQPPTAYVAEGTYLSRALDSDVENCQWHKLVLPEPSKIPAGTSVTVKTYTAPVELTLGEVQALDPEAWLTNQTNATDFLVQSAPGRFLWLKIEVRGGGVETPILAGLRAYFPRQSYLQYLPAVYQADAVSRDFLDRFLSIFEHILGGLDERAGNLWQLFDVDGVPREFLSWLGGWIDMSFDPAWSDETRRRLLRHAPELYRKRGTPEGLRLLLRLALGIEVQILEHFRLRRWVFLTTRSPLCAGAQLWDNCIVRRLQLDEFARIGEAALDGTPDPLRDPFFVQAHKFSVYVRAGLVRAELLERMLRYLVEQEKPGHTQFDVVKVEPRFRVGRQSTIGIDTHLGAYPRTVLNRCSTLGYDTLLGCGPAPGASRTAVQVGARAPGGVNTPVG
jgi:phage tail-like protein